MVSIIIKQALHIFYRNIKELLDHQMTLMSLFLIVLL